MSTTRPGAFLDTLSMTRNNSKHNHIIRARLLYTFQLNNSWTKADLDARRDYWYKQIDVLKQYTGIHQRDKLIQYIDKIDIDRLIQLIDRKFYDREQVLLSNGKQVSLDEIKSNEEGQVLPDEIKSNIDVQVLTHEIKSNLEEKTKASPQLFSDDMIQAIRTTRDDGYLPVVMNAANSNRDGSAKISRGSLEECIARYTDSLFAMMHHFRDVNSKGLDVHEFKRRYLRSCLTIMKNILEKKSSQERDKYINSRQFLKDLLEEKDAEIPIHYHLQNNVYEVPPEGGFVSYNKFYDDNKPASDIVIIYSAAPDRRRFEGGPYDALCTSNPILKDRHSFESLNKMITLGVRNQCETALKMAKKGLKPSLLFALPGCGAFENPKDQTAQLFVNAIKSYESKLKKNNIPFKIVERNPAIRSIIDKKWHSEKPKSELDLSTLLIRFANIFTSASAYLSNMFSMYFLLGHRQEDNLSNTQSKPGFFNPKGQSSHTPTVSPAEDNTLKPF